VSGRSAPDVAVVDWLARVTPPPPQELAAAIRAAMPETLPDPSPDELLTAAERLLDKVLRTDCEARSSAMDLLAVDALVTHALLRASEDPDTREDFPEEAMRRLGGAWK
jgi:hypothetical protein